MVETGGGGVKTQLYSLVFLICTGDKFVTDIK